MGQETLSKARLTPFKMIVFGMAAYFLAEWIRKDSGSRKDTVDEASDDSFPASDPPAWTGAHTA